MRSTVFNLATRNPMALFGSDQVIDQFPGRKIYVGKKEGNRLENILVFETNEGSMPMKVTHAREGSLEAPTRHPIAWEDPDFADLEKVEAEMHRVFEICHGCRRCFNLCDSFPRLFDLIDSTPSEELDAVDRKDYAKVADACTLCDLCFMTKCPYVPPHEFKVEADKTTAFGARHGTALPHPSAP